MEPSGMAAFWTSLQSSVSADQLWGVLAGAIGFIAIAVLLSFSFTFANTTDKPTN